MLKGLVAAGVVRIIDPFLSKQDQLKYTYTTLHYGVFVWEDSFFCPGRKEEWKVPGGVVVIVPVRVFEGGWPAEMMVTMGFDVANTLNIRLAS